MDTIGIHSFATFRKESNAATNSTLGSFILSFKSRISLKIVCALSSRLSIRRSSHFLPSNRLSRTKNLNEFTVYQSTQNNEKLI